MCLQTSIRVQNGRSSDLDVVTVCLTQRGES